MYGVVIISDSLKPISAVVSVAPLSVYNLSRDLRYAFLRSGFLRVCIRLFALCNVIDYIRHFTVFFPCSARKACDGSDVCKGCFLYAVLPNWRGFDYDAPADVNADMARKPYRFTGYNLRKVGRYFGTLGDHLIRVNVRNAVRIVIRAAPCLISSAAPAPQKPLDYIYAIKPKGSSFSRCDKLVSLRRAIHFRVLFRL